MAGKPRAGNHHLPEGMGRQFVEDAWDLKRLVKKLEVSEQVNTMEGGQAGSTS